MGLCINTNNGAVTSGYEFLSTGLKMYYISLGLVISFFGLGKLLYK